MSSAVLNFHLKLTVLFFEGKNSCQPGRQHTNHRTVGFKCLRLRLD
jgi:hypothetical protein